MKSTLIHFFARELAPARAQFAAQLLDDRHGLVGLLLPARVILQPAPEFLVQRGVACPRLGAGRLDEMLVGAEGDVAHGCVSTIRVGSVHDTRVLFWFPDSGLFELREGLRQVVEQRAHGR